MPLFRRRPALPDDVRSRLGLGPGERALAHAELTDGWAVATSHRLLVLPQDGEPLSRRWVEVSTGRLDAEAAVLTVTWVDGAPATGLRLADVGSMEFPRVLRQCVDSSLVHSEEVALPRGASVRVALRRDADGLVTQVLGSGPVDMSDPAVVAAIDAAEMRVREAAGLL